MSFPGTGPTAFMSRGRGTGGTVTVAPPDPGGGQAYNPGVGISGGVHNGSVTFEGRLSLGILSALVVSLILFYLWTRSAQG